MAIQVVASWKSAIGVGPTSAVTISGVSAGDLLIAVTNAQDDLKDPVVTFPTDDQGNIWTARTKSVWGSTFNWGVIGISDCRVAAAPTTVTCRATSGDANTSISGMVLRVTGFNITNYADQFAQSKGSGVDPPIPAITCVGGTRLYVQGLACSAATGGPLTWIPPIGYVQWEFVQDWMMVAVRTGLAQTESTKRWTTSGPSQDYQFLAGSYVEGGGSEVVPIYAFGRGSC